MNGAPAFPGRVASLFAVSLMAITAELSLSLVLGLKAFSHMVYLVISFALLGYGVGTMLVLFLRARLLAFSPAGVTSVALLAAAISTAATALVLPSLPVDIGIHSNLLRWDLISSLASVYAVVALPFVSIGFLVGYLFSSAAEESATLYFWDLLGAALGAAVFFPMLSFLGPLKSLFALSAANCAVATVVLARSSPPRKPAAGGAAALGLILLALLGLPEPVYTVDRQIGFEWIPGHFPRGSYEEIWRKWHPLGRTDLHRMKDPVERARMVGMGHVTFELCLDPLPEFSTFTNSYRAGTPVYELSAEGLARAGSKLTPFSQPLEFPYLLLDKPRVLIIGAGGGRDIFTAKAHHASEIVGAEINPGTHGAMSPGGVVYEYSGRIYTADGVKIHNIDGRHLVKTRPSGSCDLVILNGVDTFAALSTGAYAFAENYLYTQEALVDYLRVLSDGGLINFNRWYEPAHPRETLRMVVMILDALRVVGVRNPWEHLIVGRLGGWGLLLVKRSAFTDAERSRVLDYFGRQRVEIAYAPDTPGTAPDWKIFSACVDAYRAGTEAEFIKAYWADISSVHDDSPFFYKFYKFNLFYTLDYSHPGGGATSFQVQAVIVAQTVVFLLLFIFLPLAILKRRGLTLLPKGTRLPFLLYFACLGMGFIFIEITLMQKFTLALGSPIYSLSITLATLLLASGIGSVQSPRFVRYCGTEQRLVAVLSGLVAVYLAGILLGGNALLDVVIGASFPARVLACSLLLVPIGVFLGCYFPLGLKLLGARYPEGIAWAWGVNLGFTVLGSTITIFVAQFAGFRTVLAIAAAVYVLAGISYRWMSAGLRSSA
jgi:hypothetical protein